MRISDWSSDVCSSDLAADHGNLPAGVGRAAERMRIDRRAMIGRVSLQKSDRDRLAVLGVAHAGALAEDFGRADPRAGAAENILFVDAQGRAGGIAGGDLADEAGDVDAGDRKSTRLNSSH